MIYKNPLKRLINASKYSFQGFYYALKHEQAFRYEVIVFTVMLVMIYFLPFSIAHKIFLALSWLPVMAFELVNSAVERALDLIDKNFRLEIKVAKDMLSASVFIMVSFNIILWVYVLVNVFICR